MTMARLEQETDETVSALETIQPNHVRHMVFFFFAAVAVNVSSNGGGHKGCTSLAEPLRYTGRPKGGGLLKFKQTQNFRTNFGQ